MLNEPFFHFTPLNGKSAVNRHTIKGDATMASPGRYIVNNSNNKQTSLYKQYFPCRLVKKNAEAVQAASPLNLPPAAQIRQAGIKLRLNKTNVCLLVWFRQFA